MKRRLRSGFSCLAITALMAPMVAMVVPLCSMAESCPMMGQMESTDCHGEQLTTLDCCSMAEIPAAPEPTTGIAVSTYALVSSISARAKLELPVMSTRVDPSNIRDFGSDRPLYTLYDTLLI